MLNVNFNGYGKYVTDQLYQWDKNRVLSISGLDLDVVPEIHFTNVTMDKAIVRQSTVTDGVIKADIPNSLLQAPFDIIAYIGVYEGTLFKTIETLKIPVITRARPADYTLENTDGEIYSFVALENQIANMVTYQKFNATVADLKNTDESNKVGLSKQIKQVDDTLKAQIANIVAHNNDTEGNTELTDIRTGANGTVYNSAGDAVRGQVSQLSEENAELKGDLSNLKNKGITPETTSFFVNIECLSERFVSFTKKFYPDNNGKITADNNVGYENTTCTMICSVDANKDYYFVGNMNRYVIVENETNNFEINKTYKVLSTETYADNTVKIHTSSNARYICFYFRFDWNYFENDLVNDIKNHTIKMFPYKISNADKFNTINVDNLPYKTMHGKKILFMGDSITQLGMSERGWVKYFCEKMKPSLIVNTAVIGCKWADNEGTVYNGNPTTEDSVNNVMGNQIEKILRGKDTTHPNYSKVDEYNDFDIIIIACGTNDVISIDSNLIEYINSEFIVGSDVKPLADVNRRKWNGIMRYAYEKLRGMYPNSVIFFCSPIQASAYIRDYRNIRDKGKYMDAICRVISDVNFIDTERCGICELFELNGANGRDLIDGLHPNVNGAKKIAEYNFREVFNYFHVYD